MLAETLVYLILDTSWVANMLIQSDMTPHIICLWEEDKKHMSEQCVFCNFYVCISNFGKWAVVRNWYIKRANDQKCSELLPKMIELSSSAHAWKLAFRRYVWQCIWIWASHKLCLRWANWNNCSLDGKIELIAARHCARKRNIAAHMRRLKYPWRGRGMAIGFAVCPPRSEKWALRATNVHKHQRGCAKI